MSVRILLIDDRPQDRFLAKRALAVEFPDLIVVEPIDRAEFDASLDRRDADLIITDYQLRWSDGLEVLSAVRARGLDTPVVMFTHTGGEEIAAAGLRAGLSDYIIKTPTHYGRLAHAARIALQNGETARRERDARRRERDALRTAEEAVRLKDEFLATLSHELRTPLNAIVGWLQIIRVQPDPERLDRGLGAIERNTALLARLIADLVDVSRIVSGTLTLQLQATDMRKVVEAALDSVRPAAQAKELLVEIRAPERLDPMTADPDRVQQIVWNLLSNAVKFTPPRGRVTVRIAQQAGMLEVAVTDTGPGIQAEFLPRIFDRFSQQDGGINRGHGGMGLGLAIVRHLTELHGGRVSVESVEGAGATFTVRLPVATAAPVKAAPRATDRRPAQLLGIRVLVVDDDPDALEVSSRMLADQGAVVETAHSAAEGYERLTRARPDVLVCDVGMPGEDGFAFLARLRQDANGALASIPAMALTAYAREQDRQLSFRAGFNSHLAKPVSALELVRLVRNLVP